MSESARHAYQVSPAAARCTVAVHSHDFGEADWAAASRVRPVMIEGSGG